VFGVGAVRGRRFDLHGARESFIMFSDPRSV
jgi:hypothetical protein